MALRNLWLAAIGSTLAACAAPVDSEKQNGRQSAQGTIANDEAVAADEAALASSTLPDELTLVANGGGPEQRVYTPQGFRFSVKTASANGTATIINPTSFLVTSDVSTITNCKPRSGPSYFRDGKVHLEVRPGGSSAVADGCSAGDSITSFTAGFDRIYSDAPDVSSTHSDCSASYAAVVSEVANSAAPLGTINLCAGRLFRDRRRSTWGSAEFVNNGSSAITVNQLSEQLICTDGKSYVKSWSPQSVAAGQTVTSTISCPSGTSVSISASTFTL